MLHLVCALHCEAKPLIDFYHLKQVNSSPFPLFKKDDISLIICGIGKVNAAGGVALLYKEKNQRWLNIGIAGHPCLPVGTPLVAHKIQDKSRSFYPFLPKNLQIASCEVITVDTPDFLYPQEAAYDMEAIGFYAIASRFSTVERIHSIKVISDNKGSSHELLNKQIVSDLIENQLQVIDHFIKQIPKGEACEIDCTSFLQKWHFTESQKHALKQLLTFWKACKPDKEIFDDQLNALKKTQDVLTYLQQKIDA